MGEVALGEAGAEDGEAVELLAGGGFEGFHRRDELSATLHSIFQNGKVCYNRIKPRTNGGFERLYLFKRRYYLITGIGSNGFIISAYPTSDLEAQKRIKEYAQ